MGGSIRTRHHNQQMEWVLSSDMLISTDPQGIELRSAEMSIGDATADFFQMKVVMR